MTDQLRAQTLKTLPFFQLLLPVAFGDGEECSEPDRSIGLRFVTTLLASVERCFRGVFTRTSLDGGKLRRGVGCL